MDQIVVEKTSGSDQQKEETEGAAVDNRTAPLNTAPPVVREPAPEMSPELQPVSGLDAVTLGLEAMALGDEMGMMEDSPVAASPFPTSTSRETGGGAAGENDLVLVEVGHQIAEEDEAEGEAQELSQMSRNQRRRAAQKRAKAAAADALETGAGPQAKSLISPIAASDATLHTGGGGAGDESAAATSAPAPALPATSKKDKQAQKTAAVTTTGTTKSKKEQLDHLQLDHSAAGDQKSKAKAQTPKGAAQTATPKSAVDTAKTSKAKASTRRDLDLDDEEFLDSLLAGSDHPHGPRCRGVMDRLSAAREDAEQSRKKIGASVLPTSAEGKYHKQLAKRHLERFELSLLQRLKFFEEFCHEDSDLSQIRSILNDKILSSFGPSDTADLVFWKLLFSEIADEVFFATDSMDR